MICTIEFDGGTDDGDKFIVVNMKSIKPYMTPLESQKNKKVSLDHKE